MTNADEIRATYRRVFPDDESWEYKAPEVMLERLEMRRLQDLVTGPAAGRAILDEHKNFRFSPEMQNIPLPGALKRSREWESLVSRMRGNVFSRHIPPAHTVAREHVLNSGSFWEQALAREHVESPREDLAAQHSPSPKGEEP